MVFYLFINMEKHLYKITNSSNTAIVQVNLFFKLDLHIFFNYKKIKVWPTLMYE